MPCSRLTILLMTLTIHLVMSTKSFAHHPVNLEDYRPGKISMSALKVEPMHSGQQYNHQRNAAKKAERQERFLNKLENRLYTKLQKKSIGNISDPEDKWFWIWTGSWGIGLLITIITGATLAAPAIGIFWFMSFIVGSVALIIWLLKRFG